MTTLKAVEPLDPHTIIETCPSCTRQRVIGYVFPQYIEAVGLCNECRGSVASGRLFYRMDRLAAAFAGLRPFAGIAEWTLLKNRRFIKPWPESGVSQSPSPEDA